MEGLYYMGVRTAAAVVSKYDELIDLQSAKDCNDRARMIEFFAGSGLVDCGLGEMFETV